MAKLHELEKQQKKRKESDSRTLAQISAATAKQKRLQEFDRFNPDFVAAFKEDRDSKMLQKLED